MIFKASRTTGFHFSALAGAVAAGNLALPGVATAQSTGENQIIEQVVVTGSRLSRSGFDAPTPITVLGEDEINAEAPASIDAFVSSMPSVQGSTTTSNTSGSLSNGGAGVSALNLRALGTQRTLVLLDGKRNVASRTTGVVDINTMPQGLIKGIEIVTGGASAAYGSDAVGGVINFTLDKEFTGVKANVDYGETSRSDNENGRFSFSAGSGFADGRGHALFNAEIFRSEGIFYESRDWNLQGLQGIDNPRADEPGQPDFLVGENIGISAYTPGGLVQRVNGPGADGSGLPGTYFGIGGQPNQLVFGDVGGQWMQGGDWEYTLSSMRGTQSLAAEDNRDSFFGRVDFELMPNLNVFAQASYAQYDGKSFYIRPTQSFTVQQDNAFLPESVRQQMIDESVTSLVVRQAHADVPASGSTNERETTRWVFGAEGFFAMFDQDVEWDAYWQTGITDTNELQLPTYNTANFRGALDSIVDPVSGEIRCRDLERDPSCIPFNPLGIGVASQEGLDYVLGRPQRRQELQQDVLALNFRTSNIPGWAGPIALAIGGEYRKEQVDGSVEERLQSGWKYGNYLVTEGDYDVIEGYVEVGIPVFEGMDINAAGRVTDYSTSGSVNTWKVGLTYSPIPDVTFRATQSRDIRAPNLAELFDPGTARTNNVVNPNAPGGSDEFLQQLSGSTDVGPEEADSFGIGVVLQPRFLPGFSAAIDYYDIEINGVIGFLTADEVAELCFFEGVESFCNRIDFSGEGRSDISRINLFRENLSSLESRGLDLEASYRFDLADLASGLPGSIRLRALATHYMRNIQDDGQNAIDDAGRNTGDTPDWVYRLTAMYMAGDWTMNATVRGVSSGVVDNAYIECQPGSCPDVEAPFFTINDNKVDGATYLDLYVAKNFTFGSSQAEFFGQVRNAFDTDPELVPFPQFRGAENRPGYLPTNRNLYDVLGRTFRMGVRMTF
ncbi:TonB-dependent receptor plug domain-containing protein [Chromatocurvus halotolerans]|uniref:TonB-dependent receptor-like protein n=1 Tax=Chromatocurvus halotolerans TaxID=1132028 RepID=A0A4R2KNW2_9GAMM|nr:TonB-dependent receptor [Chromatocurvus halotolerans]TCO75861.1 TonB-dependent receptor-like protein [Chromatocurvus halotolerans]